MNVGHRGCCTKTKRRGIERYCAQKAIVRRNGKPYCWYHDPAHPWRKFGRGYSFNERMSRRQEAP